MILTKSTEGYVVQRYDTELGEWTDQDFIAGDGCELTDEDGSNVDWPDNLSASREPYLPFIMKQPQEEGSPFYWYEVFHFSSLKPDDKVQADSSYLIMLPDETDLYWEGFKTEALAIAFRDELRKENPGNKYEVVEHTRLVMETEE
jgi:hypothetical protein